MKCNICTHDNSGRCEKYPQPNKVECDGFTMSISKLEDEYYKQLDQIELLETKYDNALHSIEGRG